MSIRSVTDRLAVWWHGGLRVRILKGGAEPQGVVVGGMKGFPGDDALRLVLDLVPPAPGVVHIRKGEEGLWRVQVGGPLARYHFAQRVRNVLGARGL